jgi:hypothetical protein
MALAIVGFLIAVPMASNSASAHMAIFPEGNTNLENAYQVSDPTVSWALYSSLGQGLMMNYTAANYYKMDLKSGDSMQLTLICPVADYNNGFRAEMVLMGPGLNNSGTPPPNVQPFPGYGCQVIYYVHPDKVSFEGFTPSAFYILCESDWTVTIGGTYYLAVANPNQNGVVGNYGLVVGYKEEYTPGAYLTVPIAQFQVYQWEGQNIWIIALPWFAVVVMGFIFLIIINKDRFAKISIMSLAIYLGGVWILGSAASMVAQFIWTINLAGLVPEGLITSIIILAQVLLGMAAIWQSFRVYTTPSNGRRAGIFIIGLLSLLAWAGFIVGPVLVMIGALLPWKKTLGK